MLRALLNAEKGLPFSVLASNIGCPSEDDNAKSVLIRLVAANLAEEEVVDKKAARRMGSLRPCENQPIYKLTPKGLRAVRLLDSCSLVSARDLLGVRDVPKASMSLRIFDALLKATTDRVVIPIGLSTKELVGFVGSKEDRIRELLESMIGLNLVTRVEIDGLPNENTYPRTRWLYRLSENGLIVARELMSLSNPSFSI